MHVWSILNLLREVPAWVLRLRIWELVGVIAYNMAFALIESLMVWAVFVLLAFVLPGRWFRDRFVSLSSVAVFSAAAWAIVVHYNTETVRLWSLKDFALWFVVCLFSIGAACALVYLITGVDRFVRSVAERLLVLVYMYVVVDVLSILVVLVRNIQGMLA